MVSCKTWTLGHMKSRIPETGEAQAAYSEIDESECLPSLSLAAS